MGGFLQLEALTCPMRGVWWRPLRRCTKISISLSIRRPSFVSCVSPQPSFLYLDIVYSDAAIPGATLSSTLSSLGAASQAWIIPCNSQFTFGFVVGSQTFTLNTESLVIQLGDGTCVSAIESWTDASNNHYLLGARFISSVYLCVLVSFLYLGLTTNITFVIRIFTISKDGTQTVGFAPPVTSTSTSKSNVGAIVGGTIGGVALLLIAAGVGIFFWKRHRNQSALRATQGQFDPDLTAGDKPEGPSAIPYTIGAPSAVRNGESVQNSAASPNTQSSFRQSQIAPSPGPSDPLLLTADHPDVLPPAYEASDLQLSGGGSNTSHDRPRDVKSHLRNPSTGSAAPP